MMSKTRAFWTGAGQGFWKGATTGFIVAGLVGVGILIGTAALGNLTILFAVDKLVGAFFLAALSPPGLMLTGAAGAVYGAYNGIDDYLEIRDIERKKKAVTRAAEESLQKVTTTFVSNEKSPAGKTATETTVQSSSPVQVDKTQAELKTTPETMHKIDDASHSQNTTLRKLNIPQMADSAIKRVEQNRVDNANKQHELTF